MSNKSWYAVLTADILYNKEISAKQKVLYAIISNLANEKGYCFASNNYLAELMGTSARSLQRDLKELEDKRLIGRIVKIKASGEVEFRALMPLNSLNDTGDKNDMTPPDKSVIDNNKYINNNNISLTTFEYIITHTSFSEGSSRTDEVEALTDAFILWFNKSRTKLLEIPTHISRITSQDRGNLITLSKYHSYDQFRLALWNMCMDRWANENNQCIPKHFLNEDNFNRYLSMAKKEKLTRQKKINRGWAI